MSHVELSTAVPADPGAAHADPREEELAKLRAEHAELQQRLVAAEAAALSAQAQQLQEAMSPPVAIGGAVVGDVPARYRINVFVNLRLKSLRRLCASLLAAVITEPVSIVFMVEAMQVCVSVCLCACVCVCVCVHVCGGG